jgi:DNA processing protein
LQVNHRRQSISPVKTRVIFVYETGKLLIYSTHTGHEDHSAQDGMHNMQYADFATPFPWVALNMARATWPALHTQCLRHFTTPGMWQRLSQDGIGALEALLPGVTEKLTAMQKSQAFVQEVERLQKTQVRVVSIVDPHYPQSLQWIPDPPLVLYVHGTLLPEDGLAVAVVGSRKPSPYGKLMAQRLSTALVQHGFTVVSGLARGIDSLAHQAALDAGGRTMAVLGSGINVTYPPENRRLAAAISQQGAVLSEFPFDTKPDRWNFPRRNRIISGLALGTLVVEASTSSGTLHTARHALEQGREVFAIPGRVDAPNSQGTNGLIKSGAKLVESIADIVAELPEAVRALVRQQQPAPTAAPTVQPAADLRPEEARLLALVPTEETHIEVLIQTSQLPAHVVASILVTLELRGLIRQLPGKFFARL